MLHTKEISQILDQKEQLKILQKERKYLFFMLENEKLDSMKKKIKAKILAIENKMTEINKLNDSEKNIHVIWIGMPPKGEFDNLKIWAKYNPEYKIHIWTDFNHTLSHKLDDLIANQAKIKKTNIEKHNYRLEAFLKDEFYYNYQLKNPNKTFDENTKHFLLKKKFASEPEITDWINKAKAIVNQEIEHIKKYTLNKVILHNVPDEKDKLFPTQRYYDGYLNILEHLHIVAGASDRLRYAILNKFGGNYVDTDLMPKFNLQDIQDSKKINKLIKSLWNNEDMKDDKYKKKFKLITHQFVLLDCLNQLSEEKIIEFTEKWENTFNDNSSTKKNIKLFKEIAQKFKKRNLI